MTAEKFSIVWWNTSLAPAAKSRANKDQRDKVCAMINLLTQSMQKDFIVLGEVSGDDIDYIRKNCPLGGFRVDSGIENVGRASFDTCIIYREDKVFISPVGPVISNKGGRVLRVAQRMVVVVAGSVFHVFISHWPSRLWCAENHADRSHFGLRLRDAVEVVLSDCEVNPHVILLGDYNAEPFSAALSEHVMATRDRNLVLKRKHLFYNPFWRNLAATTDEPYLCGSYFYKSGEITQWHTFDQIIFSHAFILAQEWRLNEVKSSILNEIEFLRAVLDQNQIFDHLPVMSEIEKVA